MKRFLPFMLGGALLFSLPACDKGGDGEAGDDNPRFEVRGGKELSAVKEGERLSVVMLTTEAYEVVSEFPWCAVEVKQQASFKLNVAPNDQPDDRTSKVTVSAHGFDDIVLTVTQSAGDVVFNIEESEKSKSAINAGEELGVALVSNIVYTAEPDVDWITIDPADLTPTGFTFTVAKNVDEERSGKITIQAERLDAPVAIDVTQESGAAFFRLASEDEKSKTAPIEGAALAVALETDMTYTATTVADWITLGDETATGFTVDVDANPGFNRKATIVIDRDSDKPEFAENVIIKVSQEGKPYITNGYFLNAKNNNGDDAFVAPWIITRTGVTGTNFFVFGNYLPGATSSFWNTGEHPDRAQYSQIKIDSGYGEGTIFQTVNGIPDGTYTLTFWLNRGSSVTGHLDLVVIDSEGQRTVRNLEEVAAGWRPVTQDIEVTGGKVSIGIEAGRATGEGMWFHIFAFDLVEKVE